MPVPGPIGFGGTVDGAFGLTVNGTTTLAGSVGGTTPLAGLTFGDTSTVLVGGDVTTTGDQTYGGQVTRGGLATETTFTGANVAFNGGLDGGEGAGDVTINATGTATLDGGSASFSNINDLSATGTAALNGTITTTGNQSFGAVSLLGDTSLAAGAGEINITGGVSGAAATLTVGDANQTGGVQIAGGTELFGLATGNGNFNVTLLALGAEDRMIFGGVADFLNNGSVVLATGTGGGLTLNNSIQFYEGLNATVPEGVVIGGGGLVLTNNSPIEIGALEVVDFGLGAPAAVLFSGFGDGAEGANITVGSLKLNDGGVLYTGTGDNSFTVTGDAYVATNDDYYGFISFTGDLIFQGDANISGTIAAMAGDLNFGGNVTLMNSTSLSGTSGYVCEGH